MSHRFTNEELLLISRAVASYQHNSEFRAVIEKVEELTGEERAIKDRYGSTRGNSPTGSQAH